MPARETEAIILKTFPLGEADRLVSFFGRSSGRLRGVASGARLLKNRYGSTLEILSHVQLWYVERRGSWQLPLAYFAFGTVRLGGWLPPLDRCAECGTGCGEHPGFHCSQSPGLLCENCRKPGMRPLSKRGRELAGVFAGKKLDQIELAGDLTKPLNELREVALSWIEFHTERRLQTREFLETT